MRTILLASLFLALASCGPATKVEPPTDAPGPLAPAEQSPFPTIPTDVSAGLSGVDNMTWQFGTDGRTATGAARPRLMYASYGSEGMALNLQCDPGTGNAYAILWRGQMRPSWPFALQSGAARTQVTGTGAGESEIVVTAPVRLGAPALAAFRGSGALTLVEGGRTVVMDAINDEERRAITSFFEACS